jgi:hypothetical protein
VTLQPSDSGRSLELADLLDRLVNAGVVLTGDIVLSVADIDLIHVGIRLVIEPVGTLTVPHQPSLQGQSGPRA